MRRVGPGRRLQTQNDTQDTDAHQGRSISGGFREPKWFCALKELGILENKTHLWIYLVTCEPW